jgi:glutamyl-tRNA synthetase
VSDTVKGRFAPSPTGDLHLGGAYAALVAWLRTRAAGGTFLIRIEDLDPPRVVPGSADGILDDLEWLGLDWDEGPRAGGADGPYFQSQRTDRYEAAVQRLDGAGLVYPCTCTRGDLARASSAPHAEDGTLIYPGTCRNPARRRADRIPSWRLRVPDDERRIVSFTDLLAGPQQQDVAAEVGDFVLRRADGLWAYQLAVVVDDLEMGVTEVVRGADLLSSTARQILLAVLLGSAPPAYLHLPVVLGPDGERLAKRHQARWRGSTIAQLREAGISAAEIRGTLASALGLIPAPEPYSTADLLAAARISPPARSSPWTPPADWIVPRPASPHGER